MASVLSIPEDRELRGLLRQSRTKSAALAFLIFAADVTLYALAVAGAMAAANFRLACLCGIAAGFATAMLFVVGHDACHGSFTPFRPLNGWIGRIAFLPSLTPFSTWRLGHNQTHHIYTNLKPLDYVWAPLSKTEYDALPGWRRALERFYRTPPGVGAYYLIEIWLRRLILPQGSKVEEWVDCGLCWSCAVFLSIVGWAIGPRAFLTGVVLPFVCFQWLMGWAIFEHHTHPSVPWFNDQDRWRAAQAQSRCTVHVALPGWADALLHRIMQHSAHHLDVTIPLYRLKDAQNIVESAADSGVIVYRWTPVTFLRHLRMCKLYDFESRRWLDFKGNPTTQD